VTSHSQARPLRARCSRSRGAWSATCASAPSPSPFVACALARASCYVLAEGPLALWRRAERRDLPTTATTRLASRPRRPTSNMGNLFSSAQSSADALDPLDAATACSEALAASGEVSGSAHESAEYNDLNHPRTPTETDSPQPMDIECERHGDKISDDLGESLAAQADSFIIAGQSIRRETMVALRTLGKGETSVVVEVACPVRTSDTARDCHAVCLRCCIEPDFERRACAVSTPAEFMRSSR
jgi:hypothetical protein